MTKKALVLLADGAEEMEFTTPVDVLRRAGVQVTVAGVQLKNSIFAQGSRQINIVPDVVFEEQGVKWDADDFDAVICPGGMGGALTLKDNEAVQRLILKYYQEGKIVSFICAGTLVALSSGLPAEVTVTSYPAVKDKLDHHFKYSEERVVVDKNVITSRGPGTAFLFALTLAEQLAGKEVADKLKKDMLAAPTL
ncbi:hypothetical protein LRAMOSA00311 [Lichtheimia ramosa]|uniref:D-lactate dehydratase n=1 Tax=Lichtheimia ramosa TaxID=688394 RepID=A0A077W8P7_9FUNG|nr:hypothetical protein LRAMOSA00311 [Lichtheimia ramosa]